MIGFFPSIRRRTFAISGCFLLLATLLIPAEVFCQDAKETRLKQNALAIPLGWPVQVNLKNGDVLHGRIYRCEADLPLHQFGADDEEKPPGTYRYLRRSIRR